MKKKEVKLLTDEERRMLDDMQEEMLNEMSNDVDNTVQRLLFCMNPHRHSDDKTVYHYNNFVPLLKYRLVNTREWVAPPHLNNAAFASLDSRATNVGAFYENLRDTMIHDYFNKLVKMGVIESYKSIIENHPYIDLSTTYKTPNIARWDLPDIKFTQPMIEYLRTRSWYVFVPCYNDFVIKMNHKLYYHIQIPDINEKDHYIKTIITAYCGDKYDWAAVSRIEIEFSYKIKSDGSVKMSFEIPSQLTYEDILLYAIDKMGWSKQHKRFWYDIFSVCPRDDYIHIKTRMTQDIIDSLHNVGYGTNSKDGEEMHFILSNREQIVFLQKVWGFDTTIESEGEAATRDNCDANGNEIVKCYSNIITAINYLLYTEPRVQNIVNDQTVYNFGTMTVRAASQPTIPFEKHIIKSYINPYKS